MAECLTNSVVPLEWIKCFYVPSEKVKKLVEDKMKENFPTKDKCREKSQMYYIEVGLDCLVELIKEKKIESIAIPPLGCGNGGLNWMTVKKNN